MKKKIRKTERNMEHSLLLGSRGDKIKYETKEKNDV